MISVRQIRVVPRSAALPVCMLMFAPPAKSSVQTLDEVYKKAVAEGSINFYGTLAQVNAEKILPVFEKKFPGIKINHVDITFDNLVARAVTEARGGKTLGDIFQAPLEDVGKMFQILADWKTFI